MHSPFVFRFILQVLNNRSQFYSPASIKSLRKRLLKDDRTLEILDLGAGSRVRANKTTTVRQLMNTAVKPEKYSELLYRLVAFYQPQNIVELGTSLGVTTASLAAANPAAQVITIEGSPQVAGVAAEVFSGLNLQNIKQEVGDFDELLPSIIGHLPRIDLAYVDGNHRYQPTMDYFKLFLSKHHNDTIMVFDDIHWSPEMEQAWREIQQHEAVRCTIDIFFLGFVFFRNEFKAKQHFTIRF